MLDVNDNMDELFRRAAENYPLKTDGADWEKVADGLPVQDARSRKINWLTSRRNLLLLFALLPVAFICNRYSNTDSETPGIAKVDKTNQQATQQIARTKAIPQASVDVNTEDLVKARSQQPATATTVSPTVTHHTASSRQTSSNNNSSTSPEQGLHKDLSQSSPASVAPTSTGNIKDEVASSGSSNVTGAPQKSIQSTEVHDTTSKASITQTEGIKDSNQPASKIKPLAKKRTGSLYAGVVGNVDISSVKLQSLSRPGTGAGLLIGYQLTKRLSIESGVYTQKKYYYTDGKYYNPETPYTAPTYKLLNVDGNCSMFEVPFNVKYDFKTSGKSRWFTALGMSSYFMKKENYTYTSESWGRVSQKDYSYNNSSNAWLSVINISSGYQRQLGKSGTFRVEPYLKIPVKGVGWGRLPLQSAGVSVGYIKTIF
jgi:hypothetical protein